MTVTLNLITVVTDSCLRGWSALIVFKQECLSSSNKDKFSEREVLNNHAKLAANSAKLSGEKLPQKVATLDIVVGKLIDEQISTLNG